LAEAEAIIAAGCVSHNQLRFYPDAMDVSLELDLDEVERYAAALEDFTRPEPLPCLGRDGKARLSNLMGIHKALTQLRRLAGYGAAK
jgi:hypothetical protein